MGLKSTLRLWALVDLCVTAPLLLPTVALDFLAWVYSLNGMLGGSSNGFSLTGLGLLFTAITGTLGVAWALARLLRPLPLLGGIDTCARLWVGALILYGIGALQLPGIMAGFVVSEWLGALHQFLALRKARRLSQPPATA